jgi:CRP-like cAMP-binding protein
MTPRFNTLLAELPASEYEKLAPHMELVSLVKGETIFKMGDIPTHVYYPVGAIVSMMIDMADCYSVETYMLGKSSTVGALNAPSFYRAYVRSSGLAYRLPMSILQREYLFCPVYMRVAMTAMRRMLMQLSQSIACGKHHSLEQQLIRWMLITLDRISTSKIAITHKELSGILGFRREAMTLSLKRLTGLGYIESRRGEIEVINRKGLEALSCDCYWIGQEKKRPVG